ncbi:uncharacterized protein LOC108164966 isoform X2 [Drosophila miranda]|uniref:uncharacterized protein LOC108164966 isoform X2 n=1 Tax=Drosophila miranda TaxID=7229 RepID=UPI00143F5861|nr:uncharacterized protein LOC108164966 isoform X2 [Drosophila miranda]
MESCLMLTEKYDSNQKEIDGNYGVVYIISTSASGRAEAGRLFLLDLPCLPLHVVSTNDTHMLRLGEIRD